MNTTIILLIVGVFLAVGVIIYFLTRDKKSSVYTKSVSNTQDTLVGDKTKNVTVPILISENGNYILKPQDDANLVVYDSNGKYYWNSYLTSENIFPRCDPVNSCKYTTVLQPDGNLVTYSNKNNTSGTNVTWSAAGYPGTNFKRRSDSSAPYTLKFYNNGQLGIYDSNSNIIWSSGYIPPDPTSKCSGPDFTGKTWKKVYSVQESQATSTPIGNTSGSNVVYISGVKSNPQNIMTYLSSGIDLPSMYISKDKGNTFNKIDYFSKNNIGVNSFKVFNNFQLTATYDNKVYLSTDGFNTIKNTFDLTKISGYPKPSSSNNRVYPSQMSFAGSDDGSHIYIPIIYYWNPSDPSQFAAGIANLSVDASFNITGKFHDFSANHNINSITSSNDGKVVGLVYNDESTNNKFLISQDYGETWTLISTRNVLEYYNNFQISMNNDGSIMTILWSDNDNAAHRYCSYDFGVTWEEKPTQWLPSTVITMSADGWTQLGVSSNGVNNIFAFRSRDMGTTWWNGDMPPSQFESIYGFDIFMSYDYSKIFVLTGESLWSLE